MEFNIIVCVDNKYGISKKGEIPWKIKEDMDYFKDLIRTKVNNKQNVIVSGRKTFEKMGVIKDSYNIVFTKVGFKNDSIIQVQNKEEFISKLSVLDYGKIFICGGTEIYDIFLNYVNESEYKVNIYLNLIDGDFSCDTFIPNELIKYCKVLVDFIDKTRLNNTKMIVENLLNSNFYNFIRFDPAQIKLKEILYNNTINIEEQSYLSVMKDLLISGTKTNSRNGITYSKFGKTLEFDLRNGFPLLTTKKMFFKGVCEELLFFIRGDTNAKHLSNKGIKIWEKNTDRKFLDLIGFNNREEGDMGPMYGFQLRHFNAKYTDCNNNYDGEGMDQLQYVLRELKSNPHSRRIIMTTYNPQQASQGVLFPCHGISIQFNVTEINNEYIVNLSQNQRSADYFLGIPFNIASYALLLEMVCHHLNYNVNNANDANKKYIPGKIILFLGDYHIYESHRNQCVRQINRYPMKFPQIKLNPNKTKLEDFELEDFEIQNYYSYPGIIADMVA